jgi:hypothetical protein
MITARLCGSIERFIYLVMHSGNLSVAVTVYTNCNLSGRVFLYMVWLSKQTAINFFIICGSEHHAL